MELKVAHTTSHDIRRKTEEPESECLLILRGDPAEVTANGGIGQISPDVFPMAHDRIVARREVDHG